jgi:hypothetical protein
MKHATKITEPFKLYEQKHLGNEFPEEELLERIIPYK